MSLLKKLLSDKKVVASALSTLLLLVTVVTVFVVMLPRTKAWFAKNDNVTAGGMSLSAKEDYLRFDDTFTAKAVMGNVTVAEGLFKRDTDRKYYLYDEDKNEFSTDDKGNKQTLYYGSLFPGEYIEFEMRITCATERIGTGYRLYFSGLSKSQNFTTKPTDGSQGTTYSILGVYRLALVDVDGKETDKGFLSDYTNNVTDDNQTITEGIWDKAAMDDNGYITVKFRLYIDLTQYYELSGTYSNLLSEKSALIDNIVLAPKEDNQ